MRPPLVIISVVVMACTGGGAAELTGGDPALATPAAPTVIERTRLDVRYASQSSAQRLDLYLPTTGAGPFPLVVWIHGGGFSGGTKTLADDAPARRLADRGFAIASLEYRLSGEARFPAAVLDLKAALRHLRANASLSYRPRQDRRVGEFGWRPPCRLSRCHRRRGRVRG